MARTKNPCTATTCTTCSVESTAASLCHVNDGRSLCCGCWNAEVAERKAARKIELAAARKARKAQPAPVVILDAGGWACIPGLNRMMAGK